MCGDVFIVLEYGEKCCAYESKAVLVQHEEIWENYICQVRDMVDIVYCVRNHGECSDVSGN